MFASEYLNLSVSALFIWKRRIRYSHRLPEKESHGLIGRRYTGVLSKVMLPGQAAGLASPAGACWNGHLNVDKTLAHHL